MYSYIWYVDVYEFNRRTRKTLSDWAYALEEKEKDNRIILSVMKGDVPKNLTIGSLSNLLEFHDNLLLITLDEMENII